MKTPTVVTRTNLTTSDAEEMERLKLLDGMARHELKKSRMAEYCDANGLPVVKPFVLISTKDTEHAAAVRARIEADNFCDGRYKGKVIEIHSGKTGAESDENVARLLAVENPTNTVEVVVHVNMLKEGWDVRNLCTIIPLRASISEILTEQTIGRGLRLPFGRLTGDEDLDSLEIVSHDQYARLIEAAKNNPLFRFKKLDEADFRPVTTVAVSHGFIELDKVLDRLAERQDILFTSELTNEVRLNDLVKSIVAEQAAAFERRLHAVTELTGTPPAPPGEVQQTLLPTATEPLDAKPFDATAYESEIKELLRRYAHANIDVPLIVTDTVSECKLEPFTVAVTIGPLELVDQHVLTQELASGKQRVGGRFDAIEVDNPRGFLAGRLIDAIEELDVANDKNTVLALVDDYLAKLNKPAEELGKIVHLYRDQIVGDLQVQIESHIHDTSQFHVSVRRGFVKFKAYAKSVLEKDGIVHYLRSVPPSDVRRYLFEGFTKSFYPRVPFDSVPEKVFAAVLERDREVSKWIRPPEGNVPIW